MTKVKVKVMRVVLVHGWSVTDTSTYGRLPEALAARASEYDLEIQIDRSISAR